jgi:alpha-mannosidase
MTNGLQPALPGGIETFPSRAAGDWRPLELLDQWRCPQPDGGEGPALAHPWGPRHRPDWADLGKVVWPRGGQWWRLRVEIPCPQGWRSLGPNGAQARLALRWWADQAELWVDDVLVHRGDLFDPACRWPLPPHWWEGESLRVELRLRSPLHDDGVLTLSRLELEPCDPADPLGLLAPIAADLASLRREAGLDERPSAGVVQVLGHAHLDLAWLWPVADAWEAAERTFESTLALMERFPSLHFGHSTPALYAWLEQHRPALFARIRIAMRAGRWEPLNGPWVETDCVLISTASLLRQFQEGQHYSQERFPEWSHPLVWLPDSFGFAAGLPAVAAATGVGWFCTNKLAWNATNPFPHRLFRWRSRCGTEVLALITAGVGTDGDPLAIERYRLAWQRVSGVADALWLPGVGDHGGGPTAEMLEQLALWEGQPVAAPQRHGTLRAYLAALEPLAQQLPVWRDELYLELHRGCATSRPDQKRHQRSLERLLREAELSRALLAPEAPAPDWRPLLFQQFHDILPGTSIPEVFDQAEPEGHKARLRPRRQRDRVLLAAAAETAGSEPTCTAMAGEGQRWWLVQLQPLPAAPRTLRLPPGRWSLLMADGPRALAGQVAPGGGHWLQVPAPEGVGVLALRRTCGAAVAGSAVAGSAVAEEAVVGEPPLPITAPVRLALAPELGAGCWRLDNGLIAVAVGPAGVEQLWDGAGVPQLAAPLRWRRWRDQGEFWDAWDLAANYRDHPLDWTWQGEPEWREHGPLAAAFVWRGQCGTSPVRLEGRLLAGTPWLELTLSLDWRQRHELLQLEIPLAGAACRWAADTSGGVIERPATPRNPREQARWQVAAISWMASVQPGPGAGLAVLLDGPQGVTASAEQLAVALLRAPTWPDPGADNGLQRQRLALMPCPGGWRAAAVPRQARRLREPLWCRPVPAALAPAPWFPALADDLELVALETEGSEASADQLRLTVQNGGPCRRRLELGTEWQLLERLDGLGTPLGLQEQSDWLGPWQLGFWRLRRR